MSKNKSIISAWQRLVKLLQIEKKDVRQIFYYAIFSGILGLSVPIGIQSIINLIQGAQISTSWIILVILVTLGVALAGVMQVMQVRITENIQQKIFTRSTFEFAYRFPKIKMNEFHGVYPPELANRFFDTLTLQKSLSKLLVNYPQALLQIIFGLLLLSLYHPFFIIFGLILVLLLYLLFKYTSHNALDTSLKESKSKYETVHWIQEVARSTISFKLSGTTTLALDKNDQLTYKYLYNREKHFKVLLIQFIQLIGFKVLVTAGLLIIGGLLVLNQEMNIGQFVAAELIILIIIGAVEKLVTGLESFYDLLTALEKLGNVVDREIDSQHGDIPFKIEDNFTVQFSNVRYDVPDRNNPIINNLNLVIPQNTTILLKGCNGSGKATLLKLIAGIIQPTQGNIFINDTDLRGVLLNYYRSFLGTCLSEETPFKATLRENITFGDKTITDDQIYWTIDKVGLRHFLKEMPAGLNTEIYPEGKHISSTVAKKIVLARSIIHQPKLLLLKDPLDHFDSDEATRIINFLTDKSNNWSLVVVSQNPLWKDKCDQVITIDNGTIK